MLGILAKSFMNAARQPDQKWNAPDHWTEKDPQKEKARD
jgi:hypothetical protein